MMEWLVENIPNAIVLLLVAALVVLAVRSIVRGGALNCSGDCGGECGGSCESPRLKLSKEQLARLAELDEEYGV